jgi:hypothetical protein
MMMRKDIDRETLEAALIGLQHERDRIDAKIAEIRARISATSKTQESSGAVTKKRVLSSESRRRIAAAQKKRWFKARTRSAEGTSGTGPRREE